MISRLIAAVQAARTRPPGPASVIVGAGLAALGLALAHRYHRHQLESIDAATGELDRLERLIEHAQGEVARQRRELEELTRLARARAAAGDCDTATLEAAPAEGQWPVTTAE